MNEFEFRPDRTTDYGVSCPWASKKYPYRPYNGENDVSTFSLLFLIGSFWYFHVTRTSIEAWMSLNFLKWDLTLAHWTQVSDRCPLGYLYESAWPDVWPKINVGHCDLYFMVRWICHLSWKLFCSWTSYFGTMSQYDTTSDLKIFIGHCDLHYMVQWFCLISWRLFDVWTLYFVMMSQCYTAFALKQVIIFSWSIDFALYLK